MRFLFPAILSILSTVASAGTLDCKIIDLATADVLTSARVEDLDLENLRETFAITMKNDFSESKLTFTPVENSQILYSLKSISDTDEDEVEFKYDKSDFKKTHRFLTTSVASASLNLDTLYTRCEWFPN